MDISMLISLIILSLILVILILAIGMVQPNKQPRTVIFAFLPVRTTTGWVWLQKVVVIEKHAAICEWDDGGYGWCEPRWVRGTQWEFSHYEKSI